MPRKAKQANQDNNNNNVVRNPLKLLLTGEDRLNYKKYERNIKRYNLNQMSHTEALEHEALEHDVQEMLYNHLQQALGYDIKGIINNKFGKHEPTIKVIANMKYIGQSVLSLRFYKNPYSTSSFKRKQKYTFEWIENFSEKVSKYLQEQGVRGGISTALLYQDGWKAGKMSTIGEKVVLHNPNVVYRYDNEVDIPAEFKHFNIFLFLKGQAQGGNSDYNDCFYDCLKYFIFNIDDLLVSPENLKDKLKIKRNDKIKIEHIDKIEKLLKDKYKINITGDFIRTSTVKSSKEINIILEKEHYKPLELKRTYIPCTRFKEKKIILIDKKNDFTCYDGVKKFVMDKKEYNKCIYDFSSDYIIITRDPKGFKDSEGNKLNLSIEEEYDLTIKYADVLKKYSNGLINLYKTGSYHDTALILFDKLLKYIEPEPICQDEATWINDASFSALIWCEKYQGEIYKYDVKSLYPYLMQSTTLKFPIKRGEFKKIDEIKEFPEFGIYRCVINKSNDENINKLFKFNHCDKYTNIDITNARKLGLNITLIQDNKPNFLHYERDKLITFHEAFNMYVKQLFNLKDMKGDTEEIKLLNTASKKILNILWGSLCEIDKRKKYADTYTLEKDDDEDIFEMYPLGNEHKQCESYVIKTVKRNSYYKTRFARLCPFLISQGRKHMSDVMYEYKEYIKQIQTDGFSSCVKIHENKNVLIGELKYEGYNLNGIIEHCNSKNILY